MKVTVYNPLPVALGHYELELVSVLKSSGVDVRTVTTETEGLRGLTKALALARHIRVSRRLARSGDRVLVTWPLLGWYELLLLSRRRPGIHLVVHDPRPLRSQIGLATRDARFVTRLRRHSPVIISHSSLARDDTASAAPRTTIVTLPHPILGRRNTEEAATKPSSQPVVGVFGQFKSARDLDLLAEIGKRLSDAGLTGVIRGRDWPAVPGWDVESRFLSEDELDVELKRAAVVLIPYTHYYQSGIAVRASEWGTAVVGARHPFLSELLGDDYRGIVEADASVSDWMRAIAATVSDRALSPDASSRVDVAWSEFVNGRSTVEADCPSPSDKIDRVRATVRTALSMMRFAVRNLTSRAPIVAAGGPVLSLTSYGSRVRLVHLAIESIARGQMLPSRVILWVDDDAVLARPPRALARLAERGLEIRATANFRSHKKYYPYVTSLATHDDPLVTADDDIMYPTEWLAGLIEASHQSPEAVICHRGKYVELDETGIRPYSTWGPANPAVLSQRNFAVGFGGVLYPARFLNELRAAGDGFQRSAPFADDVWLHVNQLRAGRGVRLVGQLAESDFVPIRGSRSGGLFAANVGGGGNDRQIAATYEPSDLATLRTAVGRSVSVPTYRCTS